MSRKAPRTAFKPGQSGNPSGRPKVVKEVQELARQHTDEAVETLVGIMKDAKKPAAARVAAANSILDRGYGKPPQHMTIQRNRDVSDLDDAELDQRIADALQRVEQLAAGAAGESGGAKQSHRLH